MNFLSVRREKGRWDFAVELYDLSGRLLTYSVLGQNLGLDVRRVDGRGLFYAIEKKDFSKIVIFRLSY